jgi:PEP-CTERM motif
MNLIVIKTSAINAEQYQTNHQNPMKPLLKISATLLLALVAGTFTQAHAQLLIDPSSVVEDSPTGFGTAPDNLISNAGLSSDLGAPGTAIALPASNAFPTEDTDYTTEYRDNGTSLSSLTFTLNTSYTVTGLYIYNYNEAGTAGETGDPSTGRGLASTDLKYLTAGATSYTDYGTITFTQAPGTDDYTGEMITLSNGPLVNVTSIEFVGGAPFAAADGEYITGLGKVRVIGDIAAPEPSTYMMFGIGVLVLLVGLRRKTNA